MINKWKWYVYILECKNGRYYTGMTWNPSVRFEQHISKLGSAYTRKYGVKSLVYLEEHTNLQTARERERQIKDWSQSKKQKLINGELPRNW